MKDALSFSQNAWAGFASRTGLVSLNAFGLVLEYSLLSPLELFRVGKREREVPFSELAELTLDVGILTGVRLLVRCRKQGLLSPLVESSPGEILLQLRRKDKDRAESFVLAAKNALLDFQLQPDR